MADGMKLGRKLGALMLDRPTGGRVMLRDLWAEHPVVMVWIRHFG